jgi:hypothetical protein
MGGQEGAPDGWRACPPWTGEAPDCDQRTQTETLPSYYLWPSYPRLRDTRTINRTSSQSARVFGHKNVRWCDKELGTEDPLIKNAQVTSGDAFWITSFS